MKNIIFSFIPLIVLYMTSETILSTLNVSPFVPLPEITSAVEHDRVTPWGDVRTVREGIYRGAPTTTEEYQGFNFRAFLPPRPKKAGVKRVVFIGDSFIFGVGVPDYETLPFYLSAYLRQYRPDLAVEMVNLGVYGANTQQYVQLSEIGARYQPDVVVLGFTIANDAEIKMDEALPLTARSAVQGEEHTPSVEERLWDRMTGLRKLRDFILPHSRTFSLLYRPIRKMEARSRQDLYMKLTFDDDVKWQVVQKNLKEISNFYRRINVPVVFMILPYMFSTKDIGLNNIENYRYQKYHDKIYKIAREEGFLTVDIINYFKKDKVYSFDEYIVDGDGHPNGHFNAVVARYFARDLFDLSLL